MNIFDILPIYATKWQISTENPPRSLNKAELDMYVYAKVVQSEFGFSAELIRMDGGVQYIPIVKDNPCGLGDVIDLKEAKVVTLCKPGEKDIIRLDF